MPNPSDETTKTSSIQVESLGEIENPSEPALKKIAEQRKIILHYLFIVYTFALLTPVLLEAFGRQPSDKLWQFLTSALTGLTGLLGAAIAFYFRSDSGK